MKLYHKLLPKRITDKNIKSIKEKGLLPRLPSEYKYSLPHFLQDVPIVWLAEKMNTVDGVIFSVNTDYLDSVRLHKLKWNDVNWWVYEGIIRPELLAVELLAKE